MDIRIIGIDASLSSTGYAVADCSVNPKHCENHRDNLFSILTKDSPTEKERKSFDECFVLVEKTEIKENKETVKKLAEARKNLREDEKNNKEPKLKDLQIEEDLSTFRIQDQVNQIMNKIINSHKEDSQKTFVFIEDYSYHSPGSITQLAEMKGLLKVEMNKFISDVTKKASDVQSIFYLTANINTIKKVSARNGNAPKELICKELSRFGYSCDLKNDDEADAIAICLGGFYSIFHRLTPFVAPNAKTAKERNYYKSFIDSLNTFSNRIASKEELLNLLNLR